MTEWRVQRYAAISKLLRNEKGELVGTGDHNQDKVVIVTGGAKGIGRAITLAFSAEGARVATVDVDDPAGTEVTQLAQDRPGPVQYYHADVSQAQACADLVRKVTAAWGPVDVLCNNVGIQPTDSYMRAHEMPEETWDRILDVNLKSAFLMCKYVIPHMQAAGGGVIINTASVQGLMSANLVPAYAASKGGMLSLTRNLCLDYAADNIRVVAVNPGTVDTPLVAEAAAASLKEGVSTLAELQADWASCHPIGRIAQPEEIAHVVTFLATDRASFMTGSYVNVDGGMMAKGAWA